MSQLLSEMATVLRGGIAHRRGDDTEGSLEPCRMLKPRDLRGGSIASPDSLETVYIDSARLPAARFELGDIAVAVAGEDTSVAPLTPGLEGAIPSQHVAIVRPKTPEHGRRLLAFLASDDGKRALRARQVGTAMKSIPTKGLLEILVP